MNPVNGTLITMDPDKKNYQIPDGYLINHLLQGKFGGEDKRYIFLELNVSLIRIMDYCYANTADRCAEADECYYCVVNQYARKEMKSRRASDPHCSIVNKCKRVCGANYCSCLKSRRIHYALVYFF